MRKPTAPLVCISAFFLGFSLVSTAAVRKGPYLMFGGDPSQMTVLWQLDTPQNCTIRWGLTTDCSSGSSIIQPYGDTQYKFTITGLVPATLYYYQVDGVGTGSFRTAPDGTATSVKLLAYSDPQGFPSGHDATGAAIIDLLTRDPFFQTLSICGGDRADEDTETMWTDQYFARGWGNLLDYLARVPVAGPRGNHESNGIMFKKYYPYPYVADFYWSFDYGPVHVIVLDQFVSYAPGSPQYQWLVGDLSSTSKAWKIISFHMPGWSAGGIHENQVQVQQYIQPLCLEYGIDLVISGHNHYYARADVGGVQHLTTGGASNYFNTPVGGEYIVTSEGAYHYMEIDIQGREASVTARRRDGSAIETFIISHGPSIRITSPQNGSTLLAGQTTSIQARVLPAGGTCTAVYFYADDLLIGTDETAPYELAWVPTIPPSSLALVAKALIAYQSSTETIASAPVTVNITDTPPPQGLSVRVSQSSDDAEESASGGMYLTSSDLELVYDGSNQKVGLRYSGIAVPQGAIITSAYVQFKVDEPNSESTFLTIQGEDADQAAAFSSLRSNISSRSRTAAAVPWSPNPWTVVGAAGPDQRTPDITPVIQEIVDRPGWASGNSLALIITGTGHRTAAAFDGDTTGAPLLHIEYSTAVPGNHPPVAVSDSYAGQANTALQVEAPGVLGNDTDQDGDTLTAALNSEPVHGTVALNANGAFTYTPNAEFAGTDSFTYHANDGAADSGVATVVITITAANQAPVVNAGPDQVIVLPNRAQLAGSASDDGLPSGILTVKWSKVSGPGSVTFANANTPYTTAAFSKAGTYTLRLTATDGVLSSSDNVIVNVKKK